jgi:3-mercaptopyruvate sulfurtransferase SseA
MSKTKIILTAALLILTTAACNAITPTAEPTQTAVVIIEPTTPPTQATVLTEASVPRVEVEKAKAAFDSGEAIIVDVRSKQAYDVSHVAGAINIQLGEFETNINGLTLDKNQWIITYCT